LETFFQTFSLKNILGCDVLCPLELFLAKANRPDKVLNQEGVLSASNAH
jgi:hypothetical protein